MESLIEYSKVEVMRNEHVALRDVDFSVAPGEFVYLLGRVGSGKTSLMKTIYAEVPVTVGEARVFDYDLTRIRPHDIPFLRRKIGIVFQDFQLLPDRTAFSNLDFVLQATGWKDKSEREARSAPCGEEVNQSGLALLNNLIEIAHIAYMFYELIIVR